MKKKEVSIFLDCGAPSLYNFLMRKTKSTGEKSGVHAGAHFKDREKDDFSFIETKEYKEYRDNYIAFIKEYGKYIDVYSNLDVINNPEATLNNQKYLEKAGLKPIPVFHLGNDSKYLEAYLKQKKYDYIALGGVTPNSPSVVQPILDRLWVDYLIDKKGMPLVKVHGFAVTSLRLMLRYPWYSVDSTSWVLSGRFGGVYIPIKKDNKYIYDETCPSVTVSSRSESQKEKDKHINSLTKQDRAWILKYFSSYGYKLGESTFKFVSKDYELKKCIDSEGFFLTGNESWASKASADGKREVEVIIKPGLCNDYKLRDEMNIIYFLNLEKNMKKWPWALKLKITKVMDW